MTNHTPGPWAVSFGTDVYLHGERFEHNRHIADCDMDMDLGKDEREANARLVAAAPELLEALKYVRRFLRETDHDVEYVDAAIAKAEGLP